MRHRQKEFADANGQLAETLESFEVIVDRSD